MRQRFVATFAAQCDAIRTLVDEVAALNPRGPVAALTQILHRLTGFAGTIGFPAISARASDLESLVAGAGGRGAFDASAAREAVQAIRNALAKDLAKAATGGAKVTSAANSPRRGRSTLCVGRRASRPIHSSPHRR